MCDRPRDWRHVKELQYQETFVHANYCIYCNCQVKKRPRICCQHILPTQQKLIQKDPNLLQKMAQFVALCYFYLNHYSSLEIQMA